MTFLGILDPFLLFSIISPIVISLFLLATSSVSLFWQQSFSVFLGFILFVIFASIDYKIWSKFVWFIYTFCIILLVWTLLGQSVRGTTRWIELLFIRIQPSEIIKPFFILIFAHLLTSNKSSIFLNFLKRILLLLPIIFFVFRQPDLGNVIVYLAIYVSLELIGGLPLRYFLIGIPAISVVLPLTWFALRDYQRQRIISFLNPNIDPTGAGYNALQSMIAVGSGRFFGMGLGKGTQSKLLFLPEYHTDFVFASIVESLGFIGGLLLIVFYFLLLGKILLTAFNIEEKNGKLIAIGVFTQIFVQVFINIGMNMGILPITGITLPLISYGGNSIISTFIGLGLVVAVSRPTKKSPLVIR